MPRGRPREAGRIYIHTSLSHPTYDRMEHHLEVNGKIPPGAMRDFIEECVERYFLELDAPPKLGE